MSSPGKISANYESLSWLRNENEKRDQQIAALDQQIDKNFKILEDIRKEQIEGNEILRQLAIKEETLDERQKSLSNKIDVLTSLVQSDRRIQERKESSDKICKAIAGIIIIGLLATGIAVGVIRYA